MRRLMLSGRCNRRREIPIAAGASCRRATRTIRSSGAETVALPNDQTQPANAPTPPSARTNRNPSSEISQAPPVSNVPAASPSAASVTAPETFHFQRVNMTCSRECRVSSRVTSENSTESSVTGILRALLVKLPSTKRWDASNRRKGRESSALEELTLFSTARIEELSCRSRSALPLGTCPRGPVMPDWPWLRNTPR